MSFTAFHRKYRSPLIVNRKKNVETMKISAGNFLCCSLEVQRLKWPWRGLSSEVGGQGWSTVEAGPPCRTG
jgi:hypothetical protein